jgi:hypothetical protein
MLLFGTSAWAQDSVEQVIPPPPDTAAALPPVRKPVVRRPFVRKVDSTLIRDSLARMAIRPASPRKPVAIDTLVFTQHPFYSFTNPIRHSVTLKQWHGKEAIFYSIIALLLFFAVIRNGFNRYIQDLFKIFFRTTVNQRQVKEQLLQSPLPSFFLNIFFLLSIGMFLALLLQYFKLGTEYNFWLLFVYCILGLMGIYALKFVSLKLLGWIFQVSEAADAYIFIVFTTNKVIGIALLPFLVLLAFTYGTINQAAMSLSIFLVIGLLAYRFFLSYLSVYRQVRINFFHFLLYLCAFELVPLLLINKLLFSLLGERS